MPSDRVLELLRQGAAVAMAAPEEWLREIEDASLSAQDQRALAEDPELGARLRLATRADLLHWAASNVRAPGAPVPARDSPERPSVAREPARRGFDRSALQACRSGQNAAWLRWMSIAFELTSDIVELRELLDFSAQSIARYLDATVAAATARMGAEREELVRGRDAECREVVTLLLNGASIPQDRAGARLGYPLERTHTAAVVWDVATEPDPEALERTAGGLAREFGVTRFLSVTAGPAMLWVWVPAAVPARDTAARLAQPPSSVRVAMGNAGTGVEGFRRSHLEAVATHEMMARLHSDHRLAFFETVEIVSLVTQNPAQADQFVRRALGDLAAAPRDLRRAVSAYIHEDCNATRAAARLFTHRNTLLRRLERAQSLLPHSLEGNSVRIAVALDVLHWRGRD